MSRPFLSGLLERQFDAEVEEQGCVSSDYFGPAGGEVYWKKPS